MRGYKLTIRYMLNVIQIASLFIGIVRFSASVTTAYTLVSLAERQASFKLIQTLQINLSVCNFISKL
jgi:hypothetical protein